MSIVDPWLPGRSNTSKDSASAIAPSLTKIINMSLLSGTFPDIWKIGKVIVPLFKSGNPTSPNNYRPITILPTWSKIIDRIVHLQMYTFLQEHHLIASEQFGFRSRLFTNVALAQFTEQMLDNLDKKLITGAVYWSTESIRYSRPPLYWFRNWRDLDLVLPSSTGLRHI